MTFKDFLEIHCDGKPYLIFPEAYKYGASRYLGVCDIRDAVWVADKLELVKELQIFAIDLAEIVALVNPDPRVRAAIEASKKCLTDANDENRKIAATAWAAMVRSEEVAYSRLSDKLLARAEEAWADRWYEDRLMARWAAEWVAPFVVKITKDGGAYLSQVKDITTEFRQLVFKKLSIHLQNNQNDGTLQFSQ